MLRKSIFALTFMILGATSVAMAQKVPSVHSNMIVEDGRYVIDIKGKKYVNYDEPADFGLEQMKGNPKGTKEGISFDFGDGFDGTLYYGFVPQDDSRHPLPVYFRRPMPIEDGKAQIPIAQYLRGTYDMVGWEQSGKGVLGYRVMHEDGELIYDGLVGFTGTGPFEVDVTLIEGPFVNQVTPEGATITYQTNERTKTTVRCGSFEHTENKASTHHEVSVGGLEPDSLYTYQIEFGDNQVAFELRTAPRPGTRKPFTFAYASDSRSGQGGGERTIYGANAYIMKKITALARFKDVRFMQFSGDLIDGYLTDREAMQLQYANWKRAIQPFAHYYPVYVSMGNHESYMRFFWKDDTRSSILLNRWPYDEDSGEVLFAENFSNPKNGPSGEDGSEYDPDPKKTDFPSYDENVFYYVHDNVAVVVLNSDYWYAPTHTMIPKVSGGLHGYIMDNQLNWLRETMSALEEDDAIDHVFVTQHTPCFPNGGHVGDDMWYRGNNQIRPYVAGKPVRKGIIERRDEILDILVNQSTKTRAILTGDEHNYNRLKLTPETNIYPDQYFFDKIELSRTIYQINNGAAGAPYYAQEQTPWTPFVSNFTTQNALVFFHVRGDQVQVEVLNPDTLEEVDKFWITE
ncbi:MAG: metallophosphoesterase [Saprospiraceae bacterium]|nr:metallophosphoesterase [Saprospiraceae bacterium]